MSEPSTAIQFKTPTNAELQRDYVVKSWKQFIDQQVKASGAKLQSKLVSDITETLQDFFKDVDEFEGKTSRNIEDVRSEVGDIRSQIDGLIASAAEDLQRADVNEEARIQRLGEDLRAFSKTKSITLRKEFTDRFDAIDARLKELDGQDLLTTTVGAVLRGNIAQVHNFCDGILLHDAKILEGSVPKFVSEVIQK